MKLPYWLKIFTLIAAIVIIIALFASYFYMYSKQETASLNKEVRFNSGRQFIKLPDGWTSYRYDNDTSKETIVLIHGGGIAGSHVWEKTRTTLQENGFNVLVYDLYGRGYSDRPEVMYTPQLLLEQFEQLIDSLSIKSQFNIVALSLGAMVAVDYANKYPQKLKNLIFIDPILQGNYKPNFLLKVPLISKYIMTAYWYPRAVENQRKEFVNMELFEEYAQYLRYFMNFKGYKRVNYSTWMHILQENYIPALKKMGEKHIHTLLIFGNRDPYFPVKSLDVYKDAVPGINVMEVDQTGHMPHYEKPLLVNKEIVNFIKPDNKVDN